MDSTATIPLQAPNAATQVYIQLSKLSGKNLNGFSTVEDPWRVKDQVSTLVFKYKAECHVLKSARIGVGMTFPMMH